MTRLRDDASPGQAANAPLPDGYVIHMPAQANPLHVYEPPVNEPAKPSLGRHPQKERTCKLCGVIKITVLPPDGGGWREWRYPGMDKQFVDEPRCVPAAIGASA